MIQKGISQEMADVIGKYVRLSGPPLKILQELKADTVFMANQSAKSGIEELELLFTYLGAMNCLDKLSLDLSLARGLDYYTGVIFEAIHLSESAQGIGSILGGGRYDGLVGRFCSNQVPSVGFRVGVERILAEKKKRQEFQRDSVSQVLVVGIAVSVEERLKLCQELWSNDIATEFIYEVAPKVKKQYDKANASQIPWVVTLGETELKEGRVNLKNMKTSAEISVPRGELVSKLKSVL